jgi:hypothetical protein
MPPQNSLGDQVSAGDPPDSPSPMGEDPKPASVPNEVSPVPENPPDPAPTPVSPTTEPTSTTEPALAKQSSKQTILVPKNPDTPCGESWVEEGEFCIKEASLTLRFQAKAASLAIKEHLTLNGMAPDGLCQGLKGADLVNGVCVYTGGSQILQALCPDRIQGCRLSVPSDAKATGTEEMFFSFDSGGTQESCQGPNFIYTQGFCLMPILAQVNPESVAAYCQGLGGEGLWQARKDGGLGCELGDGVLGTKIYVPDQKPDLPKGPSEFSQGDPKYYCEKMEGQSVGKAGYNGQDVLTVKSRYLETGACELTVKYPLAQGVIFEMGGDKEPAMTAFDWDKWSPPFSVSFGMRVEESGEPRGLGFTLSYPGFVLLVQPNGGGVYDRPQQPVTYPLFFPALNQSPFQLFFQENAIPQKVPEHPVPYSFKSGFAFIPRPGSSKSLFSDSSLGKDVPGVSGKPLPWTDLSKDIDFTFDVSSDSFKNVLFKGSPTEVVLFSAPISGSTAPKYSGLVWPLQPTDQEFMDPNTYQFLGNQAKILELNDASMEQFYNFCKVSLPSGQVYQFIYDYKDKLIFNSWYYSISTPCTTKPTRTNLKPPTTPFTAKIYLTSDLRITYQKPFGCYLPTSPLDQSPGIKTFEDCQAQAGTWKLCPSCPEF